MLKKYRSLPVQVRASFWFLMCTFLQKGISLITTPLFTRLLTPEEYGQYSVFNSWLGIITVFVSLKLYTGVYSQGLVKFEKQKEEYSSTLQGLTFTLVIGWTIVYLVLQDFWNRLFSLTTPQMLMMILMIWSTAVFNFWATEQRVEFQYKKLVVVTLLVSFAKPGLSILLIFWCEDNVNARILGLLLAELIGYTGLFVAQMARGKKFYSGHFWKYVLLFNIPLVPHYLSTTILNSADRIMIGRMIGDSEAGIYNLSYSVSQIMVIFNSALLQTVEPWLFKKIKAKQINEITNIAYTTFSFVGLVNIILIAFAPEIIRIFAPVSYYDAIWIIPPVSMSVYFMFSYRFFSVFEFYFEKTEYIAMSTVMGAVTNVILNYIFINMYGYYAAGYTTLLCYIIYAVCHYLFMRKICKKEFDGRQPYSIQVLLTITIVFLLLGFTFLATYRHMFVRYILILIFLVGMFIARKKIIGVVYQLVNIKEKKGKAGGNEDENSSSYSGKI